MSQINVKSFLHSKKGEEDLERMIFNEFAFELNNQETREKIIDFIERKIIFDYKIVCDEIINSPYDVNNNDLNVEIHLKIENGDDVND